MASPFSLRPRGIVVLVPSQLRDCSKKETISNERITLFTSWGLRS